MENIGPSDPRQIIIKYLMDLPLTIRTEALLPVIWYAAQLDEMPPSEQCEVIVTDYLNRSGMAGIAAIICTVAVLDHEFEGQAARLDFAEGGLKVLVARNPDFPQESILSFPMRRRHWEQASDRWIALRANQLTLGRLRDFTDSIQKSRI